MGTLTQIFPQMDNHTTISNPRCMYLGPSLVSLLLPTLNKGTIPGLPTTPDKVQVTTPLLEIASGTANVVNVASIVIATENADAATDTLNPIPMVHHLLSHIPNPLSSRHSHLWSKMTNQDAISSRSEQL